MCVNLVEHEYRKTALVIAAARGHQEVFEYLLPLTTWLQQREYARQELPQGILCKLIREDKID